jgi:hypothetical protein
MVVRRVVEFNRDTAYAQGAKYLAAQLRYFEKYCRGLPGTDVLVAELQKVGASLHQPWDERARKEVALANYEVQYCLTNRRSLAREAWADFVPNPPARRWRSRAPTQGSPPTSSGLPASGGAGKTAV